jgi:hypothetical protein
VPSFNENWSPWWTIAAKMLETFRGRVGQGNEAAVADEELALQDVVSLPVSPGHQVGVAQPVAKHQAKLRSFERGLDDAQPFTLAQERVCPNCLERDVNHLVSVEVPGQIFDNLGSGLEEQELDGLFRASIERLTHRTHLD